MVTQINPKLSAATDVASGALIAAKSFSAQEKTRPAQVNETTDPQTLLSEEAVANSARELDTAVQEVGEHLKQSGSTLQIDYDKTSGRNVFKVVDSATGGVVFQIPSEELLAAARKLRQTASTQNTSGVLVDKEG